MAWEANRLAGLATASTIVLAMWGCSSDSTAEGTAGQGGGGASGDASSDATTEGGGQDAGPEAGCLVKTCAQLGAECGSLPDNCGGKTECGSCLAGQICGGGGQNKCGTNACSPRSCAQLGASCGWASDTCAAAIACGDCPAQQTCGGGGVPNQCSGLDGGSTPEPNCEKDGVSAETEPNEDFNQAQRISSGVAVAGKISANSDTDWFYLSTCGESILKLDLTNAPAVTSAVHYRVEILDTDGKELLAFTAQDGSSGTVNITYNLYVPAAGHYYVRVKDSYSSGYDDVQGYLLTVTALPVPDGANEPNGNTSNEDLLKQIATPVQSGVEATGYIASRQDDDWYAITSDGEKILQLVVDNGPAVSSPVHYRVEVFDTDAKEIMGYSAMDGSDATVHIERNYYIPGAGTFFIRVKDSYDLGYDYEQPYHVTASLLPVPDGDYEPNGNTSNKSLLASIATPVTSGQVVTGYLASKEDSDFYKIVVSGAGVLKANLTNAPAVSSPLTYRLEMYKEDLTTLLAYDNCDASNGTALCEATSNVQPGTYFVSVSEAYNAEYDYSQPYKLTVTAN